jgi:HSP20 family protein
VTETDKEITVKADLPGMDEKNINVSLENGLLTVSGEKREEKNQSENSKEHLIERSFGAFSRSFHIPAEIDEKKVKATFRKGVLTITLPKTAPKKSTGKSIKIEQG